MFHSWRHRSGLIINAHRAHPSTRGRFCRGPIGRGRGHASQRPPQRHQERSTCRSGRDPATARDSVTSSTPSAVFRGPPRIETTEYSYVTRLSRDPPKPDAVTAIRPLLCVGSYAWSGRLPEVCHGLGKTSAGSWSSWDAAFDPCRRSDPIAAALSLTRTSESRSKAPPTQLNGET